MWDLTLESQTKIVAKVSISPIIKSQVSPLVKQFSWFRSQSANSRWKKFKLEQLECLRSEDTPRRLMITHTIESYWIPSQKKTKSKSQILKKSLKFLIFNAAHLLKLLDKMCKYEMDPMSILEDTEQTQFCPQMDRRTDGWTDRWTDGQTDRRTRWYQYTPLSTSLKGGIKINWFPKHIYI